MIIVNMMGGTGNQMFQYALGRKLSVLLNKPLKLELNFLKSDHGPDHTYWDYSMDMFNINAETIDKYEKTENTLILKENSECNLITGLFDAIKQYSNYDIYVDGYFQKNPYISDFKNV